MERPIRILGPGLSIGDLVSFRAENDEGPLTVMLSSAAWEKLQLAFDWTDSGDRRELALTELEQACLGRVDSSRVVQLEADLIAALAERREDQTSEH